MNKNGFDDLLIDASGVNSNKIDDARSTYMVFNNSSGFSASLELSELDGSNGFVINGIDERGFFDVSVSSAGDVNGDGFDDLLIGGFNVDPNGVDSAWSTYVVFGNSSGFNTNLELSELDGSNGFVINGINQDENSSVSVSGAGDVNGDGFDDLLIGTGGAGSNVVFGNSSGFSPSLELSELDGSNGFVINSINEDDFSDVSVSGAGDVNGDGLDDLLIGASSADLDGLSNAGSTYVVFGNSSGFNASLELSELNGSNGFAINGNSAIDLFAESVSNAGDVNGDGLDDLLIGASSADPNGFIEAGSTYVVFGNSSGFSANLRLSELDGSNGFAINGINERDFSGDNVSNAGDVNGDGLDDLLIGASNADPNGINDAGSTYVVFGNSSGFNTNLELSELDGSNGFVINGINERDFSGISVSGAGDVNGDGLDDLLIGASSADPNGLPNAGSTYVVFGNSSDFSASLELSELDGSNGFAINGVDPLDFSGDNVSNAGDVNGDGLDDLLISAPDAVPNGFINAATTYVVFGANSESEPEPEEDLLDTDIYRFQNNSVPGTYIYVGEQEAQNIRENFDNFTEEGIAFQVAVEPGDDLMPMYRFQSETTPGIYLFVGEQERDNINENFTESFTEEGLAFYTYDAESGLGTDFSRFQNTAQPGTYLFATGNERDSIRENFSNFVEEGIAFNVDV